MIPRVKVGAFAKSLDELRKHIRVCVDCRLVTKAQVYSRMCNKGITLTHQVAIASTAVVSLNRKAHSVPGGAIYACPDLRKHGADYAATAEPRLSTAIQVELF